MSDVIQKTKHFISNTSHDQGIRGLIKLQAETPDKMKHIPRLACLSLMQMCHDWQGIRKMLVQWNLIPKFGRQLVVRMRKRVGEDPGNPIDDPFDILKQLDRLNDKNWRQFSPKRNLPDYVALLTDQKQQKKKQSHNQLPTIIQQRKTQQLSKQDNSMAQSNVSRPSIFSKFSKLQKNDKKVQKDIFTKSVFSKQLSQKIANINKIQIKNDRNERISDESSKIDLAEQIKQKNARQDLNNITKKLQLNKNLSPIKEIPKKIISLKYGSQRQKIIQESVKDEFSFSAVKYKQAQGLSNKKQQSAGKASELDDSFLNFTNQSKIMKVRNEEIRLREENILEEAGLIGKQSYRNSAKYKQAKVLYSEQQLALINDGIATKNFIKQIMKEEGKSGLEILRERLMQR